VVSSDYAGAVSAAPSGGYSRSMAEDRDSDRYVLFVTGPVRDRLYHRFASIFDGRDVVVKVDRRVSERRRELPGSAARERRTGDRRRRRPDWIVPPLEGV
jgi:hypothetical protein